jgi:hypothetical protein
MVLGTLFFVAAVLYSSVGHAGASGYLTAMALIGLAPGIMKPTALVLNIVVGVIALVRFSRASFFSWPLLWPFALGSVPFAFLGGAVQLPGHWYRILVGTILFLAAARLALESSASASATRPMPVLPAVAAGAAIGLLSGLTGTGGGIFLSPLLLFTGWAETRETGGVSAAFIVVNSLAGLAGNVSAIRGLPSTLPVWIVVVAAGGVIGSELGSRRVATHTFRRLLALVLLVAGLKLILT